MEKFRVDEVRTWRIRLPYREPFTTSFGTEEVKETVIIGIRSGDHFGYGECVAGRHPMYSYETVDTASYIIDKYLVPSILGKEIDPASFMEMVKWIRGHRMAKATVEMALWDLYAKILGKPLYKVIGGVREKVDVGVSVGIQKTVDDLIKKIGEYLEMGYGRIKIKIKPGWDVDVLRRIRKEYPDIKLTVDANSAYSLEKHMKVLKALDEFNLLYIEQPLAYSDLVGHSKLQKELSTPVCLDESITDSHKAWEALEIDAARVINIKPGRVGGTGESIKIHDLAEEHGVPVWMGGMLETGIGRAHNVSIATLRNFRFPGDISASERYYNRDIIREPFVLEKGSKMSVRKGPGIGVEIDWEFFSRLVVKEKRYEV